MAFTSDPLALEDALKALIATNVIGQQSATVNGDKLTVATTCPYSDGDFVLIFPDSAEETEAQERQVMAIDSTTLWLSAPVSFTTATITKQVGGQYLRNVLIGDPPPHPDFPLVTINADVIGDEPLTIGARSNVTYAATVSIFTDGPDYESAHRSAWAFAKSIEHVLTQQINPTRCQWIWKWRIDKVAQDATVNASSTLKAIHLFMTFEEEVQRLAREFPILQQVTPITPTPEPEPFANVVAVTQSIETRCRWQFDRAVTITAIDPAFEVWQDHVGAWFAPIGIYLIEPDAITYEYDFDAFSKWRIAIPTTQATPQVALASGQTQSIG
jgi:hypothetical protein